MSIPDYYRLKEDLEKPPAQVVRPTDRTCVLPADEAWSNIGVYLLYGNSGPYIDIENLIPLLEPMEMKGFVLCCTKAARMMLPLWEEWKQTVLPFVPASNEAFTSRIWGRLPYWISSVLRQFNAGRMDLTRRWDEPPATPEGEEPDLRAFVLWALDWPQRLMRQLDEWQRGISDDPYAMNEAGSIFNVLREYLIPELTGMAGREGTTAGWHSMQMSAMSLSATYYWLASALRPLDVDEHQNAVIANNALHCLSSCATTIAWRVEAHVVRSTDHGLTRRVFGEPRGEMIPNRPGIQYPRTPELEARARRVVSGFYARWWNECRCLLSTREGASVTIEGPPEAYDPYPKPPDNFTTVDLIEQLGHGKVNPLKDLLGVGGFGEAWQLPDGSVLKFTTSPAEVHCVEYIQKHGLRSMHLPRIVASGEIEPGTAYWHSGLHEDDDRLYHDPKKANQLQWQGWDPIFWYVREALDDVRPSDPFDYRSATLDLWSNYGILPMDIERPSNWGKRPVTGVLVLRDLACSTPEEHFANKRREDALVQHPAEIHPSDVPSFLADRMRGDATTRGADPRDKVIDTRQLIERLGFRLVKGPDAFLGAGSYGEAWHLANGHVLKITGSETEIRCVRGLLEMSRQPVEVARIYQTGEIPPVAGEVHVWSSNQPRADSPLFWYEREYLADLPWLNTRTEAQKQLEIRNRIFDELRDRYGVTLIDTLRPMNWGVRPGSDIPVFRDLSCAIAPGHTTTSGPPARKRKGNRTPDGMGKKLRKLIHTDELMSQFWFADTWVAGGCWALAHGLLQWLTPAYGRIVSLVSGPQGGKIPQHLVVQVRTPEGFGYLDGDGLQTRSALLHLWGTQEAVRQPYLVPYVDSDARASCNPHEDQVQEALTVELAKLGHPADWGLLPLDTPRALRDLAGDVQLAFRELPSEKDGDQQITPQANIEVRLSPDGKELNASVSDSFGRYDEVEQALKTAAPGLGVVVTDEGGFPSGYRRVYP